MEINYSTWRYYFQGFSPASTSSNLSALRCGKETKDRRNRERLLQGPGSEFSLANPDMDLELDYYDYNVVNAGAAPGSYLGMDPAFLVWIPPLDPGESEILGAIEEDHHYEEIGEARVEAARVLDTEGASLTPAEYKKIRAAKIDEKVNGTSSSSRNDEILPRRLESGECKLHDEIITEYRARLNDGMLPIHRILEESRVRVSEESLSRHSQDDSSVHSDPIPNRLVRDNDKDKTETRFNPRMNRNRLIVEEQERCRSASLPRNRNQEETIFTDNSIRCNSGSSIVKVSGDGERRRSAASVRNRLQENADNSLPSNRRRNHKSYESGRNKTPQPKNYEDCTKIQRDAVQSTHDLDRDLCEPKDESMRPDVFQTKAKTPNLQRKCSDITDFNALAESQKILNAENIPLKEFVRARNESPVKVHKSKDDRKDMVMEKDIQSPDYGVEVDIRDTSRESFYDFIGEDQDGIKFADDDDEYIDNKIGAWGYWNFTISKTHSYYKKLMFDN